MKPLLLFFAGWICSIAVFAQSLCDMSVYSYEEGMPHSTVTGIIQGKDGLIWVSTWNGLTCFDGYEFHNYRPMPGDGTTMNNNRINGITESVTGNIWCRNQDERAYLFDVKSKKSIDVLLPMEMKTRQVYKVQHILSLPKGVTWILCDGDYNFRVEESLLPSPEAINLFGSFDKSLKGSTISYVYQDAQGDEWIFTDKGLTIFGQKYIDSDFPFHYNKEINESMWLASENACLAKYDMQTQKLRFVSLPDDLHDIYCLKDMGEGILGLGSDAGLFLYDTKTETIVRQIDVRTPEDASNTVYFVYQDSHEGLWIFGEGDGVKHLSKEGKIKWMQSPKDPYLRVGQTIRFEIFEDKFGTCWVLPRNGHFSYYDAKEDVLKLRYEQVHIAPVRNVQVPVSPHIRNSFMDNQGNYWAGSNNQLCKITFREKEFERELYRTANQEVRSFYIDTQGRKWIATKEHTLMLVDGNGQLRYLSPGGYFSLQQTAFGANIYAVLEDSKGRFWLGSRNNGLYLLTPQKDYSYQVQHFMPDVSDSYSLNGESVYTLLEDKHHHLWVGTYEGGLNLIEEQPDGTIRFMHGDNRLKNISQIKRLRHMVQTKDGVILAASSNGLLSFSSEFKKPEEIKIYINARRPNDFGSLSGNELMYIYIDKKDSVYVLTQNAGMNQVISGNLLSENLRFKVYNEKNGLGSDITQSMIEDEKGNLWIVCKNLLSRYNPKTARFEHFGKYTFKDGLIFSEATLGIDQSGRFYVGTEQGLLGFFPDKMQKSTYSPELIITEAKVQNELYTFTDSYLEGMELSASQRSFSLRYAALDYGHPEGIRYAYRLEGVDSDWNEVGDNRLAIYTNLPSGNFRFLLRSTNGDGVWGDNLLVLPVRIRPTFWETSWAWLLMALLMIILVCMIVYVLFTIYRLRHKVNMEQQLTNIKLRFFTDVSHELRTPLSLIAGPVSDVLENEPLSDNARENLNIVQQNTGRMLYLISQILDFRKIQNDKMKLMIEKTDVLALTRKIMTNFDLMAREKKMSYRLDCSEKEVYLWVDRDKFEKILFNLLSNAFKYTDVGKSIEVKLLAKTDKVCLSVKDEGFGIPAKKLGTIFNRFERTSEDYMPQMSSGIGLSLVKELVGLHHAEIEVYSQLGKGSEFRVCFQTGRAHFKKDKQVELIINDFHKDEWEKDVFDHDGDSLPIPKKTMETALAQDEKEADNLDERPCILVVEDNEEMQSFLCNILRRDYRVLRASNGKSGYETALAELPDLIVTDVMMPVLDGLEMIKAIKENAEACHISIIVLSAKASLEDRIAGMEHGIDDYITKPFSSSYLQMRIKSLLRQRQSLREACLASLSVDGNAVASMSVNAQDLQPTQPNMMPMDKRFIENLMAVMEKNIENDALVVDDLAEAMSMSRTVFYKKVKSLLGVSPVDFIKDIRVKRSVQWIEAGELSVAEVAYRCGFGDPNYFGKCFKKQMGMTPTKYMEQVDEKRKKACQD